MSARRLAVMTAVLLGSAVVPAVAQDVVQAINHPVQFGGQMVTTGQLYDASGIAARWPGASYSIELTPQLTLLNDVSAGLDLLVSSQGNEVRQSLNQFGLNPSWHWITLHLGDFSDDYTENTLQGTRVRGVGLDLKPGWFRFSVQSGQTQRAVFAGSGGATYAQHLYAGMIGVGHQESSFLNFTVLKAKDDPNSLTPAVTDTVLLDTIPVALRPQAQTRPQENLVVGLSGQLSLLESRLVLKGEGDGSVLTSDLSSPLANPGAVRLGRLISDFMPLRLSTSGDFAYKVDGSYSFGTAALRAGYQYVGAGYASLGLAYVINDREAYTVGGNVGLFQNHLLLTGQVQHQNDNLLHQKVATTDQDAMLLSAAVRPAQDLTLSVSAMNTVVANDAVNDTFAVNDRTVGVNASIALQQRFFGLPAVYSLTYGVQHTADVNAVTPVPRITVQDVSGSVQLTLDKVITVAPSLSLSATQTQGGATQDNVFVGFRGTGRFLGGKLGASFDASQTFANSRAVLSITSQVTYTLPWASQVTFQTRYSHYDALGATPAFRESFATLTVSRSL